LDFNFIEGKEYIKNGIRLGINIVFDGIKKILNERFHWKIKKLLEIEQLF